ncbi:MAG: alpha-glucuronidase family glycosyl hydrolase [Balneolaceae bacterium]
MKNRSILPLITLIITFIFTGTAAGQGGYDMWLNYQPVSDAEKLEQYRQQLSGIHLAGESETLEAVRRELDTGLSKLLDHTPDFTGSVPNRGMVAGTPQRSDLIRSLDLDQSLQRLGPEGYLITKTEYDGAELLVVAANEDIGILYGVFDLLRQIQTHQSLDDLSIESSPKVEYRMVNHWDNLDRLVERGYAGLSLWEWGTLPEYEHPRYTDYARFNASIGINAAVINNVNADPEILTDQFLQKVKVLADIFRPYGIQMFLSINFQSPQRIGGLGSSDPLDPEVVEFWADKADEIYELIPDFGGFLVKADSEGQPGPHGYNRTHAEGANVLASALEPHDGMVVWRAFVYDPEQSDRFREAYDEFVPLDGEFMDNVILQVKNGPIDFQPREPFSPLFGAMEETNTMIELQVTQEYFGFNLHLAYQGPLFTEALQADTYAKGEGSTVARVVDGSVFEYEHTGMAGVLNVGTDENWTGHPFVQSSWYAFGRLAWDHSLSSGEIADEWLKMTYTNNADFVAPVKEIMMESREAGVNYRSPLGLTHLYAQGHHYGPAPWTSDLPRADWTAVYYHKADEEGIGFDRTGAGSNAIEQYHGPVAEMFGDIDKIPDDYLLWFHHADWDHQMNSGRTLWEELVHKYYEGVEQVRWMQDQWNSIEGLIDSERFEHVKALLKIQERDAVRWRDSCVLYFQQFSGEEIPDEYEKPEHDLEHYIELEQSTYVPDPWYN